MAWGGASSPVALIYLACGSLSSQELIQREQSSGSSQTSLAYCDMRFFEEVNVRSNNFRHIYYKDCDGFTVTS